MSGEARFPANDPPATRYTTVGAVLGRKKQNGWRHEFPAERGKTASVRRALPLGHDTASRAFTAFKMASPRGFEPRFSP
jgi:hypothetical protein